MGIIDNIITDKQDIKNQLGSTPDIFPTVKKFNNNFEVKRHSVQIKETNLAGAMLWGHPTFGIWGTSEWGGVADKPLVLDSNVFGYLDVNILDDGTEVLTAYYVYPNNNVFYERLINDNYIDNTSTGVLDTDLKTYTMDSGEVLNSEIVAKIKEPIVNLEMKPLDYSGEIPGLVGWWKLDGDSLDSAGSNNGTWNGSESYVTGKQFPEAGSFDGSTDYLSITGINTLFSAATSFSISLWFKTSASLGTLLASTISSSDRMAIQASSTEIKSGIYDGVWASKSTANNNTDWTNLILTYDGSVTNLYINTMEAVGNTNPATTTTVGTTIGARTNGDTKFNGSIGDIRIYNKILTTQEIAAIYNEGLGKINNSSELIIEASNDSGSNWYQITDSAKYNFSTSTVNDVLKYKITAVGDVVLAAPILIYINK